MTRLDKRNTMLKNEGRAFTETKVIIEKRFFRKSGYFFSFCSLEAKLLILGQI